MDEIKQISKIFLDRFNTLGQSGFYAQPEDIKVKTANFYNSFAHNVRLAKSLQRVGLAD